MADISRDIVRHCEGITEWLPVVSTGHLILLDEFFPMQVSAFSEMFEVVIQLGAILAVVVLFFKKLNPFGSAKTPEERKNTWSLWFRVIVAVIPSGVVGVLFDDWFNEKFYNPWVVAIALILYGVAFIAIEKTRNPESIKIDSTGKITWRHALLIGFFQILAIIPGTSRSGSTILGAMLFGLSRSAAAEFSFFMAIPTMAGASLVKVLKFATGEGNSLSGIEALVLAFGCLTAFLVSLAVIKYLMDYVKRHSFSAFGIYRIVLGAVVIAYFLIK